MGTIVLQHSEWITLLGASLTHKLDADLKLDEVSPLTSVGGNDSYSLVFKTSSPNVLEQGVHLFTLPDSRIVSLFLVPIGERSLEAVFSSTTSSKPADRTD